MTRLSDDTDLSALFGVEFVGETDIRADAEVAAGLTCKKCGGGGKFIGYSGRAIGPCFACEGTGLVRTAGVAIPEGACTKCAGSGQYSPGRPCYSCNGTGKTGQEAADIDVSKIEISFTAARANGLKHPKLRLAGYTFSPAPATGRNAGSLYVKRAAGDGEYLGKITDGRFQPVFACTAEDRASIVAAASDPHAAAKAYGQQTGSCSCCGKELTNGLSIELGIGPICRDKYGWG